MRFYEKNTNVFTSMVCACLDGNPGDTNRNRYTQNSDHKREIRSPWLTLLVKISKTTRSGRFQASTWVSHISQPISCLLLCVCLHVLDQIRYTVNRVCRISGTVRRLKYHSSLTLVKRGRLIFQPSVHRVCKAIARTMHTFYQNINKSCYFTQFR